ncbi:hypothetical protein ABEV41_00515 [Geobacillus thermodenitrificans]|uniref:hypothetical protein n=1 Tax=Geobacillus thermodenitrificans TaxID=33940 RepID=UPI003D2127C9
MRLIIMLLLSSILLVGCDSDYKVGDKITLKESIMGSHTIHDFKEMIKKARKGDKISVDGVNYNILFEDSKIKVVKVSEKDNMILVKLLNGSDEGTEWWVSKGDLNRAK